MHSVPIEKYSGDLSLSTGFAMEGKLSSEDLHDIFTRKNLKKDNDEPIQNPDFPTSSTTVHDLPEEILMEIFSWFSVRELIQTIALVCQGWKLTSKHKCLWKHLSFEGQRDTTESICSLLSHATQLQILQLVEIDYANAVLRQVAISNQSLQILIVKHCVGSPEQEEIHSEILMKLIKSCSKLVEITIKNTVIYSEEFFEKIGLDLPDLKRINFNDIEHMSFRSFNRIACICKPLEEVRIKIWENDINDNDILELCTRMKNSLKLLKIYAVNMTNNALESIAQCTCLHTLRIPAAMLLTDDGVLLLSTLHNLSSFEITDACKVSSWGWQQLFIRSNWNSMRKLDLNSCEYVDDKVLEIIGRTCPNLQILDLIFCERFTSEGMSEIIKGCKQLTHIYINYTNRSVITCFPLIPTYIPNLRMLAYFEIEPTPKCEDNRRILHDLQKKLPNLKISTDILF